MLQSIHDKAQSWIAWVIVGLLIIPFALWGINSYIDGGSGAVVAEVNGKEIGLQSYQRSLQQQRQRMRSMLGSNYSPELLDNPQMRRAILDSMVENDLLNQVVVDDGFRINDDLLYFQLKRTQAFQDNGRFSSKTYKQLLAAQGMSQQSYESSLRADLMQSQLINGFRQAGFVTQSELRDAARLESQQRTIRVLTIPSSIDRLDSESATVSESDIVNYYELNSKVYEIPEQVSIEYIELSVTELAKGIAVVESDIEALYEERKSGMLAAEERRASHILIELAEGSDAVATSAAETKLAEVEQKLAAGEDFAVLAKEYSDDPGSAEVGGDLGFSPRGEMVPEFDDAMFALKVGEISESVKTEFGFHLIRLDEVLAEEMRSYDSVKTELKADIQRREAEDLFFEQSEIIANIAYEDPDSLDGATAATGLVIQQSHFFDRSGQVFATDAELTSTLNGKISSKPGVAQAAFSTIVLSDGKNSDPIELSETSMVVIRVNQHRPTSRVELDKVRESVKSALLAERATDAARKSGVEVVSKLKSGEITVAEVAEQVGLSWGESITVDRDGGSNAQEVSKRAFQINLAESNSGFGGVELRSGGYALIELSSVQDGELSSMDSKEQKLLNQELAGRNIKSHYQSYVKDLLNNADIIVFEKQLN